MSGAHRKRQPAKPKRKRGLVGIQPRFRGGRWVWRAVCNVDGHRRVGPQRDDQETAHRDYLELREEGLRAPLVLTTLADGLAAAMAHKRARGACSERTLRSLRSNCDALRAAWSDTAPLRQIATAEEVNWYIRTAQDNGRDLQTIKGKDLHLLKLAMRLAGIPWPEDVRPIHINPKPMPFFEPEEIGPMIERIRSGVFRLPDGRPRSFRNRERAADIVLLVACTGLRGGEVARLSKGDVDLERRALHVVNHKNHDSVDVVPVPEPLVPALERLLAASDASGRLFPGGEGYIDAIYKRWKKRLGEPRLNGRTLRHSHVTMALADTGDLAVAQRAGRHRSLQTTSRYVHAVGIHEVRRIAALNERFGQLGDRSQAGESSPDERGP